MDRTRAIHQMHMLMHWWCCGTWVGWMLCYPTPLGHENLMVRAFARPEFQPLDVLISLLRTGIEGFVIFALSKQLGAST
jgi:hypothetical protein